MRFIQQKHFFWSISLQGYDFEIAAAATAAAAAAAAAAKHSCKQCKYTQNYISLFKLPKYNFYVEKQRFCDLQLSCTAAAVAKAAAAAAMIKQ